VHPQKWTLENIAHMKSEFKLMGIAYDWDREIATCLPEYYKWEQLLFQRFYKEGLAYKKTGQLNFCENCQTVLANEQVHEGKCWRCDNVVTLKEMQQWYLKITNYAKELLKDHDQLKGLWPDRVLDMQKHWIGESVGAKIKFKLESGQDEIEVFTTRPDTLFGVTFVTIAPTHRLSESLCVSSKKELQEIIKKVQAKKGYDETPEKNGFFTGSYCIHPVTQKKIPIWVGDFVVAEYGTGAVMGVPAHDERDFEFAGKYQLPIQVVIQPGTLEKAYTDAGTLQNSGEFDGLENEVAKTKITKLLETKKLGVQEIQYRLRDWGISRQRYWGAPIPMIYCESCGVVPVPEKDLPVVLPTDVEFTGEGNPLEKNSKFVNVSCPTCQKPARRETDTMDTFVESSWYYARFLSPKYDQGPFKLEDCKEWLPVDRYIGGIEHACMHL
jgi:leucyl-tRNA synthetase